MKNIPLLSLVCLAGLAIACDPYDDVQGGTPVVQSVTAADFGGGEGATFTTTVTGDVTTLDITCQSVCDAYDALGLVDPEDPEADDPSDFTDLSELVLFVTMDRQVDGGAVQTDVSNCSPAASWLTVTPAPTAGEGWYSCYSPSSPSPDEGGSVVVFTAAGAPGPDSTVAGWDEFTALPSGSIHVTGTVAGRGVDVTVNRVDTATCGPCT